MSITVQKATIYDLETLYEIERECFTVEAFSKQHIAHLLEDQASISLIARTKSEIAGFIIGLIHHHDKMIRGHIYTIDVAVKHRRRGVGLKLLRKLERIFLDSGVKTCYLETRIDNVAARELYQKQGYVEFEKLEHFYRGVNGIRLQKELGT